MSRPDARRAGGIMPRVIHRQDQDEDAAEVDVEGDEVDEVDDDDDDDGVESAFLAAPSPDPADFAAAEEESPLRESVR